MKNHKDRQQAKAVTPQESRLQPTQGQIAARAHALYEASGCLPGRDLENWFQAETELLQHCNSRTKAATPVYA